MCILNQAFTHLLQKLSNTPQYNKQKQLTNTMRFVVSLYRDIHGDLDKILKLADKNHFEVISPYHCFEF